MSEPIKNRYDFVLLFDVKDGNPNGDPDAGNLPRLDPETGEGLVTDVCLKRKVRNFVQLTKSETPGFDVFVRERAVLNSLIGAAHEQKDVKATKGGDKTDAARKYMCETYYDIRTFGAVMTTGKNAGQVRGPVQLSFARSVGQVVPLEHSLTVCAARKEEDPVESQIGIQGRKYTIPYGLYRCHGFVSAPLAQPPHGTGFSEDDLNLLWDALKKMFWNDNSAARVGMATRKLVVFEHGSMYGNAPAHELFSRLTVKPNTKTPREYAHFDVALNLQDLPPGVTVKEIV
jgi:CRISPR-associated protein Csd2